MASDAQNLRALVELGFSPSEAQVYLTLLSNGASTVSEIARGSGIKRTTAYSLLEGLQLRGYVSLEARGSVKRFVACAPEVLSSMLSTKLETFKQLLPDLNALFNLRGESGTTRIYEGREAIRQVYENLLKKARPGDPYLVISNTERTHSADPKFFDQFLERRSKLGIKPRHIFSDSDFARKWLKGVVKLGASGKIFPKHISFAINMVIIPGMVVIHQLVPPLQAVVIESPVVSQMLGQVFEVVWQSLPDQK